MMNHPLHQINFYNQEDGNAYVIEASAGTGKTWTIERLFVKSLLENDAITIKNVLVVTFTIDATKELKSRIFEQIQLTIHNLILLKNQAAQAIDKELADKDDYFISYLKQIAKSGDNHIKNALIILTRAIQNFDQASIYTIHGFCKQILQNFQYECNIPANFNIVNNKSDIIENLIRNFIREKIINNPELNNNLNLVFDNLLNLFKNGEGDLINKIANKIPKTILTIKNQEYYVNYKLPDQPDLTPLSQNLSLDKLVTIKSQFLSAVIEYVNINYNKLWFTTTDLSFDELIQKVADCVEHSNQLSTEIYTEYPIAFIDEFQDTDNLQWKIFNKIYYLDRFQKRGQVIVVGDPKQAIYRFRGADVDTYIEARCQINNHLTLNANYRSHKNIINFINQLFGQNLPNASNLLGENIQYSLIEAHVNSDKLSQKIPKSHQVEEVCNQYNIKENKFYDEEVQIVTINGATSNERNLKIYHAVTFEILALLNVNPELKSKIAILVTKNREAQEFVNILQRYGVTATELKLGNIYKTSTAHDLFAILKAIHFLSNRRYFIQAVTRPIFNLPLHKLKLNDNETNPELEKLQQQFFNYQQTWQERGIISLIYALIEDISLASHSLSNRELANLWQLAELIHKQSRINNNREELIHWFWQKITNSIALDDTEESSEELIRLDNDDEQIMVTTQHKSKGLEYEILFCPFFKSNITLDGKNDFGYHLPFFTNSTLVGAQLVTDKVLGKQIVDIDNKEAHRLNYVALTRAKSRIYIYLKAHTIKNNKYHYQERPAKLVELFGYIKDDPTDTSHPLFNYPEFFNSPVNAIKNPNLLPGVIAYSRNNITTLDLNKLKIITDKTLKETTQALTVTNALQIKTAYKRQSYTMLTHTEPILPEFTEDSSKDYFSNENSSDVTIKVATQNPSKYSILDDKNLNGASFGLLFHELCENHPLTANTLDVIMAKHNLNNKDYSSDYQNQLTNMIDKAFSFSLFTDGTSLNSLKNSIHELEFNLKVARVDIANELRLLIAGYFGNTHPFTLSAKSLPTIESGFLTGFIDLMFNHQGKYWVLDYKTNHLDDYRSTYNPISDINNPLVVSMADNHYYLQYLLYLVALKRYLEQRLNIDDASELIGGSIYYYIRGIYTVNNANQAIYCDNKCQTLIAKLDNLLRGVS